MAKNKKPKNSLGCKMVFRFQRTRHKRIHKRFFQTNSVDKNVFFKPDEFADYGRGLINNADADKVFCVKAFAS